MPFEENRKKLRWCANKAIALAIQGRWEEAITTNKAILQLFPEDVNAYNRLGRALMELGKYSQAREAYSHALELDPYSNIARKNLDRLSYLDKLSLPPKGNHHRIALDLFIEEATKSGIVNLVHLAAKEIIAKMAASDEVYLQAEEQRLLVKNEQGEYLGEVEPRHGARLARLIEAGNRYIAAICGLGKNEVKVAIRETYQHPSQAGHPSFSLRGRRGFPAYLGEELLKEESEEAEEEREFAKVEMEELAEDFYELPIAEEEAE